MTGQGPLGRRRADRPDRVWHAAAIAVAMGPP